MSDSEVTQKELAARVEEFDAELSAQAEKVEAAEAERDEHLNDLQRVAAEFDNFRKRAARERETIVQRANGRLIGECLEILDDLERALAAADGGSASGGAADEGTLVEGVALVERRLRGLLEREGVAEIETTGVFDPHMHEALMTQPSEDAEGTILGVMQKGYILGDVVLRPARVAVAGPTLAGGENPDTASLAE